MGKQTCLYSFGVVSWYNLSEGKFDNEQSKSLQINQNTHGNLV